MRTLSAHIVFFMLVFFLLCCSGETPKDPAEETRMVPVKVVPVEKWKFRETISGIGTVRAEETVEIRPEISATVERVHLREGAVVQKGDLLFILDDRKLTHQLTERRRALETAEAELDFALDHRQRMAALLKRNAIAKNRFDQAQTDLEKARAEVDRLKAAVELTAEKFRETRIHAPLKGMASEVYVDEGDFVEAGRHLVTLYHLSRVELEVRLPEKYAPRLRKGQVSEFTVDVYPDRQFQGRVTFVSPDVDDFTRDFLIKVTADNTEGLLKAGAFATVSVIVDVRENRPAVPEKALVATRKGYVVYVVDGGIAHRRDVRTGLREAGRVEIVKGLHAKETVVISGHMRLSDGDRVTIENRTEKVTREESSAGGNRL